MQWLNERLKPNSDHQSRKLMLGASSQGDDVWIVMTVKCVIWRGKCYSITYPSAHSNTRHSLPKVYGDDSISEKRSRKISSSLLCYQLVKLFHLCLFTSYIRKCFFLMIENILYQRLAQCLVMVPESSVSVKLEMRSERASFVHL